MIIMCCFCCWFGDDDLGRRNGCSKQPLRFPGGSKLWVPSSAGFAPLCSPQKVHHHNDEQMGLPAYSHQSYSHQVGMCHNDEGWEYDTVIFPPCINPSSKYRLSLWGKVIVELVPNLLSLFHKDLNFGKHYCCLQLFFKTLLPDWLNWTKIIQFKCKLNTNLTYVFNAISPSRWPKITKRTCFSMV